MYPKKKALFDQWYKAMVAGATVDKPDYGKNSRTGESKKSRGGTKMRGKRRRRARIRKARKNA